jgi:hypothetical protein
MSVMSQIRSRLSNPVIDTSLAAKLSVAPVTFFDIHKDIEPMFIGTEPRFMADMYSRLAWHADTSLANRLKVVAVKLKLNVDELPTIDRTAEIDAAIEEAYQAELNAYEVGHEAMGPMHMIVQQLNIREAWHGHASVAQLEINRTYDTNSIQTIIGTPRRQEISSQYKANATIDALGVAGLLTDSKGRLQVSHGISWMLEIESIDTKLRGNHPNIAVEEIQLMGETLKPLEANASKRDIEEHAWLTRRNELLGSLSNLTDKAKLALECYEKDVNDQKALLEKYYQDDLNRIPVMMAIYEFCVHKCLAPGEEAIPFHALPTQIQVDACDQAMKALHITLDRFKNKPSYLYNSYKTIVAEADKLLRRVIEARLDKNSE